MDGILKLADNGQDDMLWLRDAQGLEAAPLLRYHAGAGRSGGQDDDGVRRHSPKISRRQNFLDRKSATVQEPDAGAFVVAPYCLPPQGLTPKLSVVPAGRAAAGRMTLTSWWTPRVSALWAIAQNS